MAERREPMNGSKQDPADGASPPEPPPLEEEVQAAEVPELHKPSSPPERGERPPSEEEVRATEVPELRGRIAELDDLWRRAVADLDNQRKRFGRDLDLNLERERERVSAEWLTVLDNLERALEHADADPTLIVDGVRAVRDQAVDLLGRLGFPRRDDVGERFDPARHSAVATKEDADVPPGTVVEVLRPGYGDDDHQLRPALVVVAQKVD
jgi:molecular chaperone GrpE